MRHCQANVYIDIASNFAQHAAGQMNAQMRVLRLWQADSTDSNQHSSALQACVKLCV